MGAAVMTQSSTTSDREIVTTRLVSAPRELVFEVWSRPEHVNAWFGPNGFTTKTKSMDFREGGTWLYEMTGPDGKVWNSHIVYERIESPALLKYRHGEKPGDERGFDVTVTFEDRGDKTEITLKTVLPTKEQRDWVIENVGAIEGAKQTLARLDETVSKLFVISHVFDAPRSLVYEAWTDPAMIEKWWGPVGCTTKVNLDLRAGGRYDYTMTGPDGNTFSRKGEYVEIVPNEKLVYENSFDTLNMAGAPQAAMRITVRFEDYAGKTLLTFQAQMTTAEERDKYVAIGTAQGWAQAFGKLEALLQAQS